MTFPIANSFRKEERLCGKTNVTALIGHGKWSSTPHIKYCWALREDGDASRILVSVPKKFFKRAVKRNLLKRRMRESYRLEKSLLKGTVDIMLVYSSPEVADFVTIREEMKSILEKLDK